MKIRRLYCFIACAVLLFVLHGCGMKQVPDNIQSLYINYLDTCKTDRRVAVENFCHYEDLNHKAMALESVDYIQSYEVQNWEKITDELWVVTTFIKDRSFPTGNTVINFVGKVGDEYWVMTHVNQVPDELKKHIQDIGKYTPTGVDIIDDFDLHN